MTATNSTTFLSFCHHLLSHQKPTPPPPTLLGLDFGANFHFIFSHSTSDSHIYLQRQNCVGHPSLPTTKRLGCHSQLPSDTHSSRNHAPPTTGIEAPHARPARARRC